MDAQVLERKDSLRRAPDDELRTQKRRGNGLVPDIGAERDQIATKATRAFADLRTEVYQMIRRKPGAATESAA